MLSLIFLGVGGSDPLTTTPLLRLLIRTSNKATIAMTTTAQLMPTPALAPVERPDVPPLCEISTPGADAVAVGVVAEDTVPVNEEIEVAFVPRLVAVVLLDVLLVLLLLATDVVRKTAALLLLSDNLAATRSSVGHPSPLLQASDEQQPRKGSASPVPLLHVYHLSVAFELAHAWDRI